MKYIYELEDIKAGMRFRYNKANEVWMVGFNPADGDNQYCIISLLDGMVSHETLSKKDVLQIISSMCDAEPVGN